MRKVELFDRPEAANPQVIVDRLRSGIRTNTRAIGITWVHSSSGVRLPIRQIADMLFESNRGRDEKERCLLVVDGVHGLGALEDSIAGLGCDFLCAGTHKWMFAPRGTGIIWGNDLNWARVQPTIPTFSSEEAFNAWLEGQTLAGPNTASRVTPGGFTAYEHQWAMSAAFAMHEQMGRARVAGRIRDLNTQCKQGLARMKKVTLHTPMDPALSAGLVAFEVAGVSPGDVVKKLLDKRVVASTSPYKVSYARLAPSLVNTPEEVDRALAAVRAIAGA